MNDVTVARLVAALDRVVASQERLITKLGERVPTLAEPPTAPAGRIWLKDAKSKDAIVAAIAHMTGVKEGECAARLKTLEITAGLVERRGSVGDLVDLVEAAFALTERRMT